MKRLVSGTLKDPAAFIRHRIPKHLRSGWNQEPELPPKSEMARNVLKSAVGIATQLVQGEKTRVSEEEANRRLEICKRCEFFRHVDQRCSKCGCFMATKTYLKAEECPTHKW